MENGVIQPGQTVTPSQSSAPEPPAPTPTPPASEPPVPEQPEQPSDGGPKFETTKTEEANAKPAVVDGSAIAWTASEFIAHAKSFGWYAALFLVAAVFGGIVFLISKDPVSVGVILFGAIMLAIYAGHKPRELEYRLDNHGLTVGKKHFGYNEFRSFSVLPEGAFSSIVFMPLKRFAVPTTIYYAPEDEDKIVSRLGDYLPLEQRTPDAIDRLMHRIHF